VQPDHPELLVRNEAGPDRAATCAQAAGRLLDGVGRWEVRSYAWAWLATAPPRNYLLIRRHHSTGELAFHYCFVPEGQPVSLPRMIRAAGCRWPVEEDFEFGKDCFGLDQFQVHLYTAIARHAALVMAALAICAVTAALLRDRTDTQAPRHPGPVNRRPPTGMIPLTVPEIGRLLASLRSPRPPGHAEHWTDWRRC